MGDEKSEPSLAAQIEAASTAKKKARKRAAPKKPAAGRVVVYMVGNSRGNKDGQLRRVSPEVADDLVANKLARRAGE